MVIGILIALQVDNWNTENEGKLKAQKVLSALQHEIEINNAQLIRVKDFNERVVNASVGLLDLMANFPENYTESFMDSLLRDYGYYLTYDPSTGALEASISSGDIHLIENDSLINLLFTLPSLISDSKEEEIQALQFFLEHKKNLLFKYSREMNVWKTEGSYLTSNQGESAFIPNNSELLKNPDFENYVFTRFGMVAELVREQNTILETNNLILSLIEQELE